MNADHERAVRDARSWCNDEQSSTGNLARCYLDAIERITALEAKAEAARMNMTNALAMVDWMIEVAGGIEEGSVAG